METEGEKDYETNKGGGGWVKIPIDNGLRIRLARGISYSKARGKILLNAEKRGRG